MQSLFGRAADPRKSSGEGGTEEAGAWHAPALPFGPPAGATPEQSFVEGGAWRAPPLPFSEEGGAWRAPPLPFSTPTRAGVPVLTPTDDIEHTALSQHKATSCPAEAAVFDDGEESQGDCLDSVLQALLSKANETWMLQNITFCPLETPFSNADLLSGQHLRQAFRSSSLSSEECTVLANRVCSRALKGAREHPVPVLGRFGQGKSSLINSLVGTRSGGSLASPRAKTGRYEATTMEVQVYRLPISDGLGDVLLCDTPGWEPEQSYWGLEEQFQKALKNGGYVAENIPDVSVFVVAGTPQGMRELSSAVEGRNLARAFAQIQRTMIYAPRKRKLLPVVTFADTVDSETRKKDEAFLLKALAKVKSSAREDFEVLDPVYVSNTTGQGVETLKNQLAKTLAACVAQPPMSRPWFSIMEEDLCAELAKEEAEVNNKSGELFQGAIAALAHLHGQAALFPPSPWHSLTALEGKLCRKTSYAEKVFGRPGLICMVLFCVIAVALNLAMQAFAKLQTAQPTQTAIQSHKALGEAMPSTYEWDVSRLGSGEHLSPLFERRGVPGMQLKLSCSSSSCSLSLLAPDSWKIQFKLRAGQTSKNFSGVFPISGTNAVLGLGHPAGLGASYLGNKVGVELMSALKTKLHISTDASRTFTWNISAVSLTGAHTSSKFEAVGLKGLSLELYPSGYHGYHGYNGPFAPSRANTCAIYLCAPAGSSITYRLFVDDVARTTTHHFQKWWHLFHPVCTGFSEFAFVKRNYSKAGVEILQVLGD